jgi:hypothetical protein
LGQVPLAGEKGNMEPVFAEIQRHFDSNGAAINNAVENMRKTFPRMKTFFKLSRVVVIDFNLLAYAPESCPI